MAFVTGTLLSFLGVRHLDGPGGFRLFLMPGRHILPFLVSNVVTSFFLGGMIRMAINQLRGSAPRIEDLFSVTDVWFDLILVAFLYGVATSLGYMLCVIPGLIVAGLFMLAIPLVVEGRLPATGALIQSWNALKSQWLVATLFHCVLILAVVVRRFLCGIGVCLSPARFTAWRSPFSTAILLGQSAVAILEEKPGAVSRILKRELFRGAPLWLGQSRGLLTLILSPPPSGRPRLLPAHRTSRARRSISWGRSLRGLPARTACCRCRYRRGRVRPTGPPRPGPGRSP